MTIKSRFKTNHEVKKPNCTLNVAEICVKQNFTLIEKANAFSLVKCKCT